MQNASPTPERLFAAINAHHLSAAIMAAIDLEIFTAIAEGASTSEGIAARAKASPRGIRVLCDYLTVHGFLTKQDESYGLPPDSALFLDKRSPAYLGGITHFLLAPIMKDSFENLTGTVRKGATLLSEKGSMEPDHPAWIEFARCMVPMMMPAAQFMATIAGTGQPLKVLDIAAGHGMFGVSIGMHNPQAEIYACDWANVLTVAEENAAKFGVASRFHKLAGSAFDVEFGTGYDVVLFPNFFHHFDQPTCESLMRKARAALKPGGRAMTLEFVPNPDRVSPAVPASFALIMLAMTAAGDAYTFAEYDTMFRSAGFARSEIQEVPYSPESLILSYS